MPSNLFRGLQKKRVINVKRLARKRRETGARQQDQPEFRPQEQGGFGGIQIYRRSVFDVSFLRKFNPCPGFCIPLSASRLRIGS